MNININEFKAKLDTGKYVLKVYNNCYGGGPPRFSKEAKEYYDSLNDSKDQKILTTIEKFGFKATARSVQQFGLCLCPIEYEICYDVDEYDGQEGPFIDLNKLLDLMINNHFKNLFAYMTLI